MAFLQDQLAWLQDKQTWFANWICQPHLEYKVGNSMYVDARHFASERDKKLLDLKNAGLWKIVRNIDNKTYKLDISETLKDAGITPIFHPWKLHLAPNSPFPGQILPLGPPIKVSAENDNKAHKEWKVLKVVDCQKIKRYGIQYKATYVGNWNAWNGSPPWQLWIDFERSMDKVHKFHHTHPRKPQPSPELATIDSSLDDI